MTTAALLPAAAPRTSCGATLATRPGMVFSRPALVKEMWSSTGADPHAVEVAIARLRPRLGPAAAALVAVPGRGYRLEP